MKFIKSVLGMLGVAASASAITETRANEENWIVFNRPPFVVSVDQSIGNSKDKPNMSCVVVEYYFASQQLKPNGMPENELAEIYYGLEDKVSAAIRPANGYMVAAETGDDIRRAWFCFRESSMQAAVADIARGEPRVKTVVKEASVSQLLELLPSELERQIAGNHRILMNLASQQDDGTAVRQVMHWIYLKENSDRSAIEKQLKALGFKIEEVDADKVRFSHMASLANNSADNVTQQLLALCASFNCDYDGWETEVVRGAAKTLQ